MGNSSDSRRAQLVAWSTLVSNRSFPPATVIPELAYADVAAAAAWLCDAFGFTERLRVGDHRVQLVFGGGAMVATDGGPAGNDVAHAVLVKVEDADAHHARA